MGSPRPEPGTLTPALSPPADAARRESARRRALRLRLVLVVAAVCAAVGLSTLFDTLHDREAALALAERQHDNVAGALAEQAARALQATDLILRQAMLLDPDTSESPQTREAIPDLLRRHMSGVPQVRNLFLFDPARQLHLRTAPTGANRDLSDRSYYRAQLAQQLHAILAAEPQIEQHEVDHLGSECPQQLCAAAGTGDAEIVLRQVFVHELAHGLVVIDDEYMRLQHVAHCRSQP